jgi:hypothetical protein
MPPIHIRDLSGSIILGNYTENIEIDDTALTTVGFSRCPIPNLGCSSPNTVRIVVRKLIMILQICLKS